MSSLPSSHATGSEIAFSAAVESILVTPQEWQTILPEFADASIYQTTEYGRQVSGGRHLEHWVLRRNGKIIAAALIRLIAVPIFPGRIAYLYQGPLWQFRGRHDPNDLKLALSVLRREYVEKRSMLLQIFPNLIHRMEGNYQNIFQAEGFHRVAGVKNERTFLLDLSQDLLEIRRKFRRNWRNHLNKALRNNLEIVSGRTEELFDVFIEIYQELLQRKKFYDSPDVFTWREIQKQLPEKFKMKVFVCKAEGKPVSAAVGTVLGDKGIYLLGATSKKGMKTQGSYLIQWEMIRWLKEVGCPWYDLGGINPQKNPGVFHFKAGMGGEDVSYLGLFEAAGSTANRLLARVVRLWRLYQNRKS